MHQIQFNFWSVKKVKRTLKLLLLLSTLIPGHFKLIAQPGDRYSSLKTKLVEATKKKTTDLAFSQSINRFYYKTCDSLVQENLTFDDKPVKEILIHFFEISLNKINSRSMGALQLPALNRNFLLTIKAHEKGTLTDLYSAIPVTQTEILQSVFNGSTTGDSINIYAQLREMLYDPFYITSRIYLPQYVAYRDTLLYELANGAPRVLAEKLAAGDTFYESLVKHSKDKTIKAIAAIKPGKYYDIILPFSMAIREKRITEAEILELAGVPGDYYHAFVTEAVRLRNSNDPELNSFLKQPIAELNRKFANHYYIKEINELHQLPNNIRFRVLDSLPAIDLYFLLLGGGSELIIGGSSALYTSSFLYVYKKFLAEVSAEKLNHFMDDIGYFEFDRFISNISDYGLVDDLVHHLPEVKLANMLEHYLASLPDLQHTDNTIILRAMTLAEILFETRHHRDLGLLLVNWIDNFKVQFVVQENFMYQRIFEGFRDILQDKGNYETDKIYESLNYDRLVNNNIAVQVCFFYDDEDATSSFRNQMLSFSKSMWSNEDHGNYIVFSSIRGNKMKVYMNKPGTEQGCEASQLEMLHAIEQQKYEITSYIHRGHSYYLQSSLDKIKPSAKFVFLGSCGGYNQVLQVFQLNPDVQIIATRGVSTKLINDPLLEKINNDIVNKKNINWDQFWKECSALFQSAHLKDLFSSYIPPNKYTGVKYIRKVFNF
ncbi:MAG: hypothetical protein WBO30_14955 [Ferruginibacter sp.]